jgi:hypothetical protein
MLWEECQGVENMEAKSRIQVELSKWSLEKDINGVEYIQA